MGNFVYTTDRAIGDSNRLPKTADEYEEVLFDIDFDVIDDYSCLVESFALLDRANIHIVGSRGYVYDSQRMVLILKEVAHALRSTCDLETLNQYARNVTRTADLRDIVVHLLTKEITQCQD